MSPRTPLRLLIIGVVLLVSAGNIQAAEDFASPLFTQRWQQDEHVVPNFWGPLATAHPGQDEPYGSGDVCRPPRQCPAALPDNPGIGHRLVQYFDKGRMELNGGRRGAIVTSGLLVRELITGQLQRGDAQFEALAPAAISVAGDSANPFPLYRDLGSGPVAGAMAPVGTPVTLLLTPQGSRTIPQQQDAQTVVSLLDSQTGHGLPNAFADFRARVGLENIGLALTDPFWADVQVADIPRRILIQAFERRVLTYNSANPARFQVEFGNVGQQYYQWRYGTVPPSTLTPPSPQRTLPTPASEPTAFQGQDCGRIEMVGKSLIDDPRNAPTFDCFWQAYQQCQAVGMAQLFVYQRFFETSDNRSFRLDGTSGVCAISEELQAFGLMANTPQTSIFTCAGLARDSGGLHFLGCGSDGDFTVPATPPTIVAATPPAVSVPTIRTITLADDGQTISLPTGTSFLLALGGDFDWQVHIADETLVRAYANAIAPPDAQGIFTALHQGQTTLTATGNPKCYNATPRCLAPSRGFTVQIVAT
ncbi:MAG: hypothetical protein M3Z19_05320 [Chloroflexota bacterium]|nr:hypothetical protein [Chloroflexota bacterium]